MKIHREMIKHYIQYMTSGIGVTEEFPMRELSNFDRDIFSMSAEASRDGNLDWLRLSLDSLIANPDGRIKLFLDYTYPFNDEEILNLFTYAFKKIWPDEEISGKGAELDLQFVSMTDEEWSRIVNVDKEMF